MSGRSKATRRRPSRRKLGKGQHVQLPKVKAAHSVSGSVLTVNFDQPAVVSGSLDPGVQGANLVSQEQVDSNTWNLTYDTDLSGLEYAGVPEDDSSVNAFNGGGFAGVDAGTF